MHTITSPCAPSPVCTTSGEATNRPTIERVQMLMNSSEHQELSILPFEMKFLDMDVQERAKGWNQVDLVMSKIPSQTLYQLQLYIIKELRKRAEDTKVDF